MPEPKHLLHLDCSARSKGSTSRMLSSLFVERLRGHGIVLEVDRLDLAETPPGPLDAVATAAIYRDDADRTPEMQAALTASDALIDRVLRADLLVFGIPMYNFGMPAVFKAFVDNIVRSGRTFDVGPSGIIGRLAGKKAAMLLATGGSYGPGGTFEGMDCLTPHLRAVFGFVGIHAQPLHFSGPAEKAAAIERARAETSALSDVWADDLAS